MPNTPKDTIWEEIFIAKYCTSTEDFTPYMQQIAVANKKMIPFIRTLLASERAKERDLLANQVIEAFGNIVPMSGEEALDPQKLATLILELYEPIKDTHHE